MSEKHPCHPQQHLSSASCHCLGVVQPEKDRVLIGFTYERSLVFPGDFYLSFGGTTLLAGSTMFSGRTKDGRRCLWSFPGALPAVIPTGCIARTGPGHVFIPANTAFAVWFQGESAPIDLQPVWRE